MSAFLIRHAKAGKRREWDRDDHLRPLSADGRRQAEAIAAHLADEKVTGLWSSPFLRCVETLEPLARQTGLQVVGDDRLSEGSPLVDSLDALRDAGDGGVLCSHGDVIPDVVEALIRCGADVSGPPNWRKASIWVLELAGDEVLTLRAEPPPA